MLDTLRMVFYTCWTGIEESRQCLKDFKRHKNILMSSLQLKREYMTLWWKVSHCVCVCVCVHVGVCTCVCVCERGRDRTFNDVLSVQD